MKRIKKILLLLLVLAYTGQGLAASLLPCSMVGSAGSSEPAGMDHSGHNMPSEADAMPAADCCEAGLCAMSLCQSAVALPPAHSTDSQQYIAFYLPVANSTSAFRPLDSLYRPPISR